MKLITAGVLLLLIFVSAYSCAETANLSTQWTLNAANSRVNFVTIKKGNIAESHTFNDVSGNIIAGLASIKIKPDSVDSRVPIRNERMREFLFETALYPTIEVTADVSRVLEKLTPGNSSLASVPVTLSMHGVSKEHTLEVRVSRINNDTIVVSSTQSVLIRAADYNMIEGITKLSSLVNNLPIAETVPINFSLQLSSNSKR